MKYFVVAICALASLSAQASQEKSLFSSYTEDSTAGWSKVPEPLAVRLVKEARRQDEADQCIRESGLAKNYHQFIAAKTIPLSTDRAPFLFVRPASQPYCGALYGAHIYSFWIVNQRREVVFSTSADALDVLPTKHNGLHDLLVSQCRGGYCYRTRYTFDAHAYRDESCVTEAIDSGERVPGCKP